MVVFVFSPVPDKIDAASEMVHQGNYMASCATTSTQLPRFFLFFVLMKRVTSWVLNA